MAAQGADREAAHLRAAGGFVTFVVNADLSASVMAGLWRLVPAIHVFAASEKGVDARDTSAFTRVFDALCAGMTEERPWTLTQW